MNRKARRAAGRKRQAPSEYFHVRHSCSHAVYWSDGTFAMRAADYPCPWCGGESGVKPVPQDQNLFAGLRDDPRQAGLFAFREFLPGRLVPVGNDMQVDMSAPVVVRHMTGDVCCITPGMEEGGSA